jgi:hypothetical protein
VLRGENGVVGGTFGTAFGGSGFIDEFDGIGFEIVNFVFDVVKVNAFGGMDDLYFRVGIVGGGGVVVLEIDDGDARFFVGRGEEVDFFGCSFQSGWGCHGCTVCFLLHQRELYFDFSRAAAGGRHGHGCFLLQSSGFDD